MKIIALMSLFSAIAAGLVTVDLTAYSEKIYDKLVQLNVGDRFEVILRENPTTGYIWQVLDDDLKTEGHLQLLRIL